MVRTANMPQPRQHVDPIRIVAISAAIAVNVGLLALLMVPLEYSPPREHGAFSIPIRFVVPPKPVVVTKTIDKPPAPPTLVTRKVVQPQPHPRPVVISPDPGPVAIPVQPYQPPVEPIGPNISTKPVEASLSPIASPAPTYPHDALRDGITGTVELELLVGVDGRVLDVRVTHGSGDHRLDNAARDQVLHSWRFQPALRDGVAVQALGRVPIVFTLDGR
jgi:protein TonB